MRICHLRPQLTFSRGSTNSIYRKKQKFVSGLRVTESEQTVGSRQDGARQTLRNPKWPVLAEVPADACGPPNPKLPAIRVVEFPFAFKRKQADQFYSVVPINLLATLESEGQGLAGFSTAGLPQ
jgi:hypothetical protein